MAIQRLVTGLRARRRIWCALSSEGMLSSVPTAHPAHAGGARQHQRAATRRGAGGRDAGAGGRDAPCMVAACSSISAWPMKTSFSMYLHTYEPIIAVASGLPVSGQKSWASWNSPLIVDQRKRSV